MIRWPGVTKAGNECKEMVSSQDFYATLAEAAGQRAATCQNMTVKNLGPLLKNPRQRLSRKTLYWHYPHYYSRMTPASAVRDGDWKLIHYYEDDRLELFNLQDDPARPKTWPLPCPRAPKRCRTKLNTWRQQTDAKAPTANPDWKPAGKKK